MPAADLLRTGEEAELLNWLTSQAENELPLPHLYDRATAIARHISYLLAHAKDRPHLQTRALEVCLQLVRAVDAASLFSTNEDADDIATKDLKYLLAPFHLAELYTSCPGGGGALHRPSLVSNALQYFSLFLSRCQQYGIMGELGKRIYEQEEASMQSAPSNANMARAFKIERFKADKALRTRIQTLESRRGHSCLQPSEEDGQQGGMLGGVDGWDEADERQLWMIQLEQAVLQALSQRGLLQQEADMLRTIEAAAQPHGGSVSDPRSDVHREMEEQQKQEVLQQLRRIAGDLSTATSSVTDRRAQIRAGVFKQGHLAPTMTLAEQAEIEMADARRREQAEAAAHQAEATRLELLGSDEDEEALKAQRAKDDWQDANPRGWGNSKLRPCS